MQHARGCAQAGQGKPWINDREQEVSDEQMPVITDKRGKGKVAPSVVTDGVPPPTFIPAAEDGEVRETTDEAMERVDRIQELREKGQKSLDGGPPLSNDEQAELLRLQAEQQEADVAANVGVHAARTAFLVVVGYDGSAVATHDVNLELEIEREASIDDMYAGAALVVRDIEASLAAKHVVFGMQQGVQQLAARQRDLSAASALQTRGINPQQLRRR